MLNPFITAVHSAEVVPPNRAASHKVYTLHDGKLMFEFSYLTTEQSTVFRKYSVSFVCEENNCGLKISVIKIY